ncbi:histidine kinase [Actinoplanes sp. TBRC 11911]|uniref:histidine kinase n=1 Tax=Actinoplanes sp. TBRC 11911 TaxID=2729386 RepID=UPI002007166A|nr:histidine kinase [Actinoplanes sp. TBRC 11911]
MDESPLPRPWRLALVVVAVATGAPALWLGSPLAAAVALVVAQAVAAWFLPVRPRAATLLVMLTSTALQFVAPAIGPGMLFVVLCSYAWLRPARESLAGLAAGIVLASGPAALRERWDLAAVWLAACLLAWSWGALGRAAGARREAERRRAVLEERARIARELHDVLSHTVSLMVVQTAAADDVFEIDPARARQAVRGAEEAGRSALAELRLFLRSVSDPDEIELQPQPSLAGLDALVTTMADAGLPVRLRREGVGEVPASVQLSAYRIVQESLTNTLRHAAASGADVLVRVAPGELLVEVRDDGTAGNGRSGPGGGPDAGSAARTDAAGGQSAGSTAGGSGASSTADGSGAGSTADGSGASSTADGSGASSTPRTGTAGGPNAASTPQTNPAGGPNATTTPQTNPAGGPNATTTPQTNPAGGTGAGSAGRVGAGAGGRGRGGAGNGAGEGRGIAGMRERAKLLGGTLTARPAVGGGFVVSARLPWKEI